jgi:phage head maturation protease
LLNSIKQGHEAFELIKSVAIGGLSIGYQPVNYHYLDNAKFRQITEVELLEISLVTFQANDAAMVISFKNVIVDSYIRFKETCDRAIRIIQPEIPQLSFKCL